MTASTLVKRIAPVSEATWPDLERLFGEDGACVGCWCMWWRTTRATYHAGRGNRRALRAAVDADVSVGLLAYADDPGSGDEQAVGWCAVAPRSAYPRWENSAVGRARREPDGRWAVPCFFVRPDFRRRGIADALLAAACEHSRAHGAQVLEAYPMNTAKASASDLFVGSFSLFARHGFVVVGQPTARRAVMERTFA